MQPLVKISCTITTSDDSAPLGLEIWLDDQKLLDQNVVSQDILFVHELSDADAEHELRFVMKNKSTEHTKIDKAGNIVKDACLSVSDLRFDEIDLGHMLTEQAVYTHNFNGTGEQIQDTFFGIMGCNGVVSLRFSTPIYLWLLENL